MILKKKKKKLWYPKLFEYRPTLQLWLCVKNCSRIELGKNWEGEYWKICVSCIYFLHFLSYDRFLILKYCRCLISFVIYFAPMDSLSLFSWTDKTSKMKYEMKYLVTANLRVTRNFLRLRLPLRETNLSLYKKHYFV